MKKSFNFLEPLLADETRVFALTITILMNHSDKYVFHYRLDGFMAQSQKIF